MKARRFTRCVLELAALSFAGGCFFGALRLNAAATESPARPAFPSNEDLRHVRRMDNPRLSPDGHQVLLRITDSTADGAKSHLWLVDVEGGTFRQLTHSPDGDKAGESSGEWAPDGRSILFLAKRGEQNQLFRLAMDGGEAVPFDIRVDPIAAPDDAAPAAAVSPRHGDSGGSGPLSTDVSSWAISPDGKVIAIIAKPPETADEKKKKDDKSDANWIGHDPHWKNLYLLDPVSGTVTRVPLTQEVESVSWSQQSDRLAVITTPPNGGSDLGPGNQAWAVPTADPKHPLQIASIPPTVGAITWATDGQRLVFLAQARADSPPGYVDLYAYDFRDASVRNLSDGFSGTILGRPAIMESGDMSCLVEVGSGTHTTVARVDLLKAKTEVMRLDAPTSGSLQTNPKRTGWVFIGSGSTQAPALYFTPSIGQPARVLATPQVRSATWKTAQSQPVRWENEGLALEGLLYLPIEAGRGKVPLIVEVHGGPTGAFLDSWIPLTDFLVGRGWAVFKPNPRGSINYGAAFAAAIKNDLGGADYRDIMTGIDAVLSHHPIDPDRLALVGYSYGGEMAAFAEGKTKRFKAIVCGAPVIDQFSEYGTEDESWYDRWYFGNPWEHPQDALRQSPISYAPHASTPFLLLQGEDDATDPLGQSQEMYRALRQFGVPVDLVQYPREDHSPLAAAIYGAPSPEPWHGFDARDRIVGFIGRAFR
jgi:dipeptidyl aminopeptidase/acylaminoacyl peptidase